MEDNQLKKWGYIKWGGKFMIENNAQILVFRLSLFGNFKAYEATTDNTIKWTYKLKEAGFDFLPRIFQAAPPIVNIAFTVGGSIPEEKRMEFISPDEKILLRILAERIDVEFHNGVEDNLENDFSAKCELALNIMETVSHLIENLQGSRLAYYVEILIPETNNMRLIDFCNNNNLGISIRDSEESCIEWGHRFNKRTSIKMDKLDIELCNVIFLVERRTLQVIDKSTNQNDKTKGIFISADLNTLSESSAERFGLEDFNQFIKNAQSIYFEVFDQIECKLFS